MKRFLTSAVCLLSCLFSIAQFTPGNIAVLQVGDGTSYAAQAAAPVSVLEYNTIGTIITTTNVSVSPVFGGNFTQSYSATSEGSFNLSGDGKFLTLVGYNAAAGTASIISGNDDGIIAKIDVNRNVTEGARFIRTAGNAYEASSFRAAVSDDGTGYWGSGDGAGTSGGVRYIASGGNSTGTQISTTITNTRGIRIFDDQLYVSSGTNTITVGTVGIGLPTGTGQTITNFNGLPTILYDAYEFVFLDANQSVTGPDLLYFCSQGSNPGLYKFSFDGSVWTSQGNLTDNVFGLAARLNCSNGIDLFITRATNAAAKPDKLYKFTDLSAYNATITSNGSALSSVGTLLATASPNYYFGGVAFTPADGYTVTGVQSIPAGSYNIIRVKSGGTATLSGNITVYDKVVVESGGILEMGNNIISSPTGIGSRFEVKAGGWIKIGSTDGITSSSAFGNVQTCKRIFSSAANYEYYGSSSQVMGDGLSTSLTSAAKLIINNPADVNLSPYSITILGASAELQLVSGNLILGNNSLTTRFINQVNPASLTDNHIVTNGTGSLTISGVGVTPVIFPVGPSVDSLNTVTISKASVTSTDFTVRVDKGIVPSIAFPTYGINRTWNIKASSITAGVTVGFQYESTDANINVTPSENKELLMNTTPGPVWSIITGNTSITPSNIPATTWQVTTTTSLTINDSYIPYAIGKSGGYILPIDCIISTRAQKRDNTGIITWNVNSCAEVSSFEVQRSVNNSGFLTIGIVNPSASQTDFNFIDPTLSNGTNLYRIKVNRLSGASRYSNTVAILYNSNDILITSLAPNPVHSSTVITVSTAKQNAVDFKVFNMSGRIVKQWQSSIPEGNSTVALNVEGLPAGVYHILASSADAKAFSRFIKQ